MKKETPNPTGRTGRPIILPPSTFEHAIKRSGGLSLLQLPKEAKPEKTTSRKK